jgi:hypothetical protein
MRLGSVDIIRQDGLGSISGFTDRGSELLMRMAKGIKDVSHLGGVESKRKVH